MSNGHQTEEQVVTALRDKIAQILSIPASSVESGKNIWNLFPPNHGRLEAKEVTEVCMYVSNEYKVYLTEREWGSPLLAKLAEYILEKQSNPERMLAQIKRDRESQRKGLKITLIAFPVLFSICGIFIMSGARNPVTLGNMLLYIGFIGLMELLVMFVWIGSAKKFNREIKPVLEFYQAKQGVRS